MNVKSIQFRLTVWYTILLIVAAIGFGAYTYSSLERRLYTGIETMLAQRVVHLREDVAADIASGSPAALARKINDIYSPEENDRFIRVSTADGTILYRSGPPHDRDFDPALIPLPRDYTDTATEVMESLRHDRRIFLVGLKTDIGSHTYVLEMGAPVTPVRNALHKLVITLLFSLPVLIAVAAAGGAFLVRRALRPVDEMRGTAEQISFNKLRQRLPLTMSGDAIDELAKTLNRMLDRLDRAYQQASRFSADASHELRTPLTIIRSEMEALINSPATPASLHEPIGSMLEEAERLSAIVENLFSLARLDAGEAKTGNAVFDLSDLARATLEQMQLLAEEKNIRVTVDAPHAVFVTGDAARLKQVIVNLLDNAIKYTMEGGSVTMAVQAENGKAVLRVKDNGMGIPKNALPHIFERFYRADKARTRGAQGAGLGLSIAEAICQAHGGGIDAASEEGVGSVLTVTLPLTQAVL